MEQSALAMHASMLAARPALLYFSPATLRAMACVRALRDAGTLAFYTMDAGPHVKVLTTAAYAQTVADALLRTPGVLRTVVASPGEGAHLVEAA